MQPAAFIDRDGVVNEEVNYLHRIEDFRFIDGVFEACRRLRDRGYLIVIVTNQSGIGRGYYSEADYHALTEWMRARFADEGVTLTGVYHCPHHPEKADAPYRVECDCRKPAPGLLLRAAADHGIDLAGSLMFGDKESDIEAGLAAGTRANVLVRSGHDIDEGATRADYIIDSLGDLAGLDHVLDAVGRARV